MRIEEVKSYKLKGQVTVVPESSEYRKGVGKLRNHLQNCFQDPVPGSFRHRTRWNLLKYEYCHIICHSSLCEQPYPHIISLEYTQGTKANHLPTLDLDPKLAWPSLGHVSGSNSHISFCLHSQGHSISTGPDRFWNTPPPLYRGAHVAWHPWQSEWALEQSKKWPIFPAFSHKLLALKFPSSTPRETTSCMSSTRLASAGGEHRAVHRHRWD